MKSKVFLMFCLLLDLFYRSSGQTTVDNNELKIIPPSPTVAQLGRYGLASARLSDGAFSTQIPVYEYKTKNLTLPISLLYSTNGLQVNKVAGRTGMDWSLVVGGSIGRMVLGQPDDNNSWVHYPAGWPATTSPFLQNFIGRFEASGF